MMAQPSRPNAYMMQFGDLIIGRTEQLLLRIQQDDFVRSVADQERVTHTLDYALKWPPAWTAARQLLVDVAPAMEQAGHRDGWIPFMQIGLEECQRNSDQSTQITLSIQLSRLYQLRGDLTAAAHYAVSAHACAIAIGDREGQANALGRLAYARFLEKQYAEAQQLTEEALALLESNDSLRASIYSVQVEIARETKKWSQAIRACEHALQIWTDQSDTRMMAWSLRDLGAILQGQRRSNDAITCYERALAFFAQVHDPIHEASTKMNLGNVYMMSGVPEEALPLFASAEPVFRHAKEQRRLSFLYANQGIALRQLKRWNDSLDSLRTSIDIFYQLGRIDYVANTLGDLGLTHLESGDVRKAIATFEEAIALLAQLGSDLFCISVHKEIQEYLRNALTVSVPE